MLCQLHSHFFIMDGIFREQNCCLQNINHEVLDKTLMKYLIKIIKLENSILIKDRLNIHIISPHANLGLPDNNPRSLWLVSLTIVHFNILLTLVDNTDH